MAKGKHAAKAAGRRLREAEERIAELEAAAKGERSAAHQRERELSEEIQTLKNRLVREVDDLADERVRAIQARFDRRLVETRNEFDARVYAVLVILSEGLPDGMSIALNESLWSALSDASGMPVGEVMGIMQRSQGKDFSRAKRRMRGSLQDRHTTSKPGSFLETIRENLDDE